MSEFSARDGVGLKVHLRVLPHLEVPNRVELCWLNFKSIRSDAN